MWIKGSKVPVAVVGKSLTPEGGHSSDVSWWGLPWATSSKVVNLSELGLCGLEKNGCAASSAGVQQRDLVTYIHIPVLFQMLFPCRLLQNIE